MKPPESTTPTRAEGGFTLVELLVVIAILGILAAVAVFTIGGTTKKSKAAACRSDLTTVQTASDVFAAKHRGALRRRHRGAGQREPAPLAAEHDERLHHLAVVNHRYRDRPSPAVRCSLTHLLEPRPHQHCASSPSP